MSLNIPTWRRKTGRRGCRRSTDSDHEQPSRHCDQMKIRYAPACIRHRNVAQGIILYRLRSEFGLAGPVWWRRIKRGRIPGRRMQRLVQNQASGERGKDVLGLHDRGEQLDGGLAFLLFVLPVQLVFRSVQDVLSPSQADRRYDERQEEYARTYLANPEG